MYYLPASAASAGSLKVAVVLSILLLLLLATASDSGWFMAVIHHMFIADTARTIIGSGRPELM